MSTNNTFQYPRQAYAQSVGTTSTNGVLLFTRDPNSTDITYKIGQQWQNTSSNNLWYLNSFTSSGGSLLANWTNIVAGGTSIDSIAVQTGTSPIVPSASGQITFNGAVVAAGTNPVRTDGTGANTMALEVQISQAIASTNATNIGLSAFNSSQFSVDANGFVSLSGGGQAVDSLGVDVSTPPGTDPVLPNSSGIINITGNQIAPATTANIIRTNSTVANTVTVEVQRSSASSLSDPSVNGVSHFDEVNFSVDTDGFVTLNPSSLNYTSVNNAASPYTVLTTDEYLGCQTSTGAITIQLPNAPSTGRVFTIKDSNGSASTNNISVTTVGGVVTIDGSATFLIATNYAAMNVIFNGTNYEVF